MKITASIQLNSKWTMVYDKLSDKNYITSDFKTFKQIDEKTINKLKIESNE